MYTRIDVRNAYTIQSRKSVENDRDRFFGHFCLILFGRRFDRCI